MGPQERAQGRARVSDGANARCGECQRVRRGLTKDAIEIQARDQWRTKKVI